MVATYSTLADGILALKRTEENLCRSILSAANGHAHADLGRAQKALARNQNAPDSEQAALEGLRRADQELGQQPEVQARLLDTIGKVYENIGLYDTVLSAKDYQSTFENVE